MGQPPDRGQRGHRQNLDHRRALPAPGAGPRRCRARLWPPAGAVRHPGDDLHPRRHPRAVRPHPLPAAGGRTVLSGRAAARRRRQFSGRTAGPVPARRGAQPGRLAAGQRRRRHGRCQRPHHRCLVPAHAARTRLRQRQPVRRRTGGRRTGPADRSRARPLAHRLLPAARHHPGPGAGHLERHPHPAQRRGPAHATGRACRHCRPAAGRADCRLAGPHRPPAGRAQAADCRHAGLAAAPAQRLPRPLERHQAQARHGGEMVCSPHPLGRAAAPAHPARSGQRAHPPHPRRPAGCPQGQGPAADRPATRVCLVSRTDGGPDRPAPGPAAAPARGGPGGAAAAAPQAPERQLRLCRHAPAPRHRAGR